MKIPQRKTTKVKNQIFEELMKHKPGTYEYKILLEDLNALCDADRKAFTLANDTLVSSAAQISTVLLILNYEKLGIITTKAFTLIPKIAMRR